MARPIVIRPQPNVSLIVAVLMIISQRIAARLGCRRVEPHFREDAAHRLDTQSSRALALVLDRVFTLESRLAQMIDIPLAGDVVLVDAVVRKRADGILPAARPQLVDVVGQHLADALQIIQHKDLLAGELDDPDRHRVRRRAAAAQIPIGPDWQQRIGSHHADTAFRPRIGQLTAEIRSLERACVLAFPDVMITIGVQFQVKLPFFLQHGREPRVVGPVRPDDDRIVRLVVTQQFVHGVGLPARIPRKPDLRLISSDRRSQKRETASAQYLPFLDPGDAVSLQRLDRFRVVRLHPVENDQPVTGRLNPIVEYPEFAAEPERSDLRLNEPFGRLVESSLNLPDADRQRAACRLTFLDQQLAEEMRFPAAAPAVGALIAGRLKQGPEYSGGLDCQYQC